jgi:hypothetical protein
MTTQPMLVPALPLPVPSLYTEPSSLRAISSSAHNATYDSTDIEPVDSSTDPFAELFADLATLTS